jgi:hypothetical protein
VRKKPPWRLLITCIVILILIGTGLIWILNEKGGISWYITAPIAFGIIACILAFLQWFMPMSPSSTPLSTTSTSLAPSAKEVLPQVPPAFVMRLMDPKNQPKGKGAIIVPVDRNEVGQEFHIMKKHEALGNQSTRRKPKVIKDAIANIYTGDGYVFYAATFGSLEPDDYLVWKGPVDTNITDPFRRRGAGVLPDEANIVYFD